MSLVILPSGTSVLCWFILDVSVSMWCTAVLRTEGAGCLSFSPAFSPFPCCWKRKWDTLTLSVYRDLSVELFQMESAWGCSSKPQRKANVSHEHASRAKKQSLNSCLFRLFWQKVPDNTANPQSSLWNDLSLLHFSYVETWGTGTFSASRPPLESFL